MDAKVDKIIRLENGNLAVKWEGNTEYEEIKDPNIATYLVYLMAKGKSQYSEDQRNSINKI